jgi:two-component system, OmpR family, sensor histidine kinase VicK
VSGIFSGGGKSFKSLQWKIVLTYSLLLLFTLQLISVYLVQSLERYYLNNYQAGLESQAKLLSFVLAPLFQDAHGSSEDIEHLVDKFGGEMEITVLDRNALVVGTSGNQALIGRRLIRDEITTALTGRSSDAVRFDPGNQERRYYLAYPLQGERHSLGIIYLSGSLKSVDATLSEVKIILLTGAGFALAITFLLGIILARTITTPIQAVTNQANLMAGGDFSKKIQVQAPDEIGQLGETFNYLAERLSHNIKEISSEKSKVEAIINNMSDGILALDGKGRLTHINPAARTLLRNLYRQSPQPGRSGFFLLKDLIGPEALRRYFRRQAPLTAEVTRDNPHCILQVKLAPFKEEKGKMAGTLIVLHDVTRERELALRQQEFVADVSHELRTPLATVKSYVETLLDGAVEEPSVCYRFLNVVERETERMVSMVKDLLDLSQMDYKQVEWHKTEVDLAALAAEVVEQSKQEPGAALRRIEITIPPSLPPVLVDRDKVMQVFSNVLNNAVKYTSSGGHVEISASPEEDMVKVFIADDGVGIPPDELQRVFERFYRVEKTRCRDYGGSGLGLSIARKIVEAHGGRIWIESEPEKGTRVWFTLPRSLEKEARKR